MNHIGIDVSKYKHDCCIITAENRESFSFENNQQGFNVLLEKLKSLNGKIKIGFEVTGHYAETIKAFLLFHNHHFMEINPYLIKRFSDSQTMRKVKTDKKDAAMIAEYVGTVTYKTYLQQSYHILALKEYTRLRAKLISERTRYYNLLTKTLDVTFPEYKSFWPNNAFSATSLFILEKYCSPVNISNMNKQSYENLRKISMGKFSHIQFMKLRELAKNSVGKFYEFHYKTFRVYLSKINDLTNQISFLEIEIADIMSDYPTKIQTIPGIGPVTAAIILGEFGDIRRFKSPWALQAFCGLEPSVSQSGLRTSVGKLAKRGSSHLRSALVNASFYCLKYIPQLYDFYKKKKDEGKHHQVALIHVTRKLIRVIYHLETTDRDFNINYLI